MPMRFFRVNNNKGIWTVDASYIIFGPFSSSVIPKAARKGYRIHLNVVYDDIFWQAAFSFVHSYKIYNTGHRWLALDEFFKLAAIKHIPTDEAILANAIIQSSFRT